MKDGKKIKIIAIVSAALSALNLLFYLSAKSMVGWIGHSTFAFFPWLVAMLLAAVTVFSVIAALTDKIKPLYLLIAACFNALIFIGFIVGAFFLSEFFLPFLNEALIVLTAYFVIAAIVFLVFYFPRLNFKTEKAKKLTAIIVCGALVFAFLFTATDLRELRFNYFTQTPVVYAVGEDYQIVWTTRSKGIGWVEVAGEKYYDTEAGQVKSTKTVHKVAVPQRVLNEAKAYTACSKAMLSEDAYSALQGYKIKKKRAFRPVDESDGIQFYAISDTHNALNPAVKAASYWGEKTDFVVLAGDIVPYVDSKYDCERFLRLASKITKGNIPVIFARGNHDTKGKYAEHLKDYVASTPSGDFYYTFRLGSIFGVVLDLGDDSDDSYRESYGTARFDAYRLKQIEFLKQIEEKSEETYKAEGVKYRVAVSHMPPALSSFSRMFLYDTLAEMNAYLNRMNLDIMINGHLHKVFYLEPLLLGKPLSFTAGAPDFISTGAAYSSVIVSRMSDTQNGKLSRSKFIGAALEFYGENLYIRFTNKRKEVISTKAPFEEKSYGKVITKA